MLLPDPWFPTIHARTKGLDRLYFSTKTGYSMLRKTLNNCRVFLNYSIISDIHIGNVSLGLEATRAFNHVRVLMFYHSQHHLIDFMQEFVHKYFFTTSLIGAAKLNYTSKLVKPKGKSNRYKLKGKTIYVLTELRCTWVYLMFRIYVSSRYGKYSYGGLTKYSSTANIRNVAHGKAFLKSLRPSDAYMRR